MLVAMIGPPSFSIKSNWTTTFRSGSMPQSSVRKCSIFVSPVTDFVRTPPEVQPMKRSSSTLNATSKYILIPVISWMPSNSAFCSLLWTRRNSRRAIRWIVWFDNLIARFSTTLSKRAGRVASSGWKSATIRWYRFAGGSERSITYFGMSPLSVVALLGAWISVSLVCTSGFFAWRFRTLVEAMFATPCRHARQEYRVFRNAILTITYVRLALYRATTGVLLLREMHSLKSTWLRFSMRRINVRLGAHIERAKVSGSESRQRPQLEKGFFD